MPRSDRITSHEFVYLFQVDSADQKPVAGTMSKAAAQLLSVYRATVASVVKPVLCSGRHGRSSWHYSAAVGT
jgi:hypothetical protein